MAINVVQESQITEASRYCLEVCEGTCANMFSTSNREDAVSDEGVLPVPSARGV